MVSKYSAVCKQLSVATARAEKAEAELKAAREQAPSGYVDGDQFRRWEVLRGTEFESPERCYMPFSVEPYESDINNCDTPLYAAPIPPAVPEEMREIMFEAASILAGESPMRLPIADELWGFANMLAVDKGETP